MHFVYIIRSESNNCYYVGCTNDIDRRINEHNHSGNIKRYTRNKGPWKLVLTERFQNLSEARQRERQIKSLKKRKAIENLIGLTNVK